MIITMDMLEHYKDSAEIEVLPGNSVFLSVDLVPSDRKSGIFCPWEELSVEQQEQFQVAHNKMKLLAEEVRGLFTNVPSGPEPGHFW